MLRLTNLYLTGPPDRCTHFFFLSQLQPLRKLPSRRARERRAPWSRRAGNTSLAGGEGRRSVFPFEAVEALLQEEADQLRDGPLLLPGRRSETVHQVSGESE